jgi:hypothetical protein
LASLITFISGRSFRKSFGPKEIFIHKGFYSETLKVPPEAKTSIVHFDCDLYQSTIEVFSGLHQGNCFQDGTVLLSIAIVQTQNLDNVARCRSFSPRKTTSPQRRGIFTGPMELPIFCTLAETERTSSGRHAVTMALMMSPCPLGKTIGAAAIVPRILDPHASTTA